MSVTTWFLTKSERGNAATTIDSRNPDGLAWTEGNRVRALVHGSAYFRELLTAIEGTDAGDVVMFTDWRGDPDEQLDGPGTEIATVLAAAAKRGVVIKGLIWRSHHDSLQFSAGPNRELVDAIQAAGGDCLLDMRVKVGGSHHQKLFLVRHQGRPEADVAFVGGIDVCHSRNDGPEHLGDPQSVPMAQSYGERPPWHDVQLEIRGPAVGDVETVFRERWNDPAELSSSLVHRLRDKLERRKADPDELPRRLPDPPARTALPGGTAGVPQHVQVLRTYPRLRTSPYPFAPRGERSIARGYLKAISQARKLIYVEDQYLWSEEVIRPFAAALEANPELHVIAVLPMFPDSANRAVADAQAYGRHKALSMLRKAGGDRVASYGIENEDCTPIYVHAKVCIIDDTWATVGSDNFNLRSWTYDSELTCAVFDPTGGDGLPRDLRLTLNREHLGRSDDDEELLDPAAVFAAFAACARDLDAWHDGGRSGPRPVGRLRAYQPPEVAHWRRPLARMVYQAVCDPDGRPTKLRLRNRF
ncbi:phosphatidylserine/phosphatidylglycerophosphate/cardiolipin synthase-like enzyme [Allocatelliglobosispora scoriae]|uniref:Phosphatidylserine/phosphatidylglycerophosphate/ cardiolipin synthase-like enzyme n=1 Tax=Allocatelliglobosispora scoriae TaxID=643052 RepID=A0A841BM77_9ACTN|nr:phospholipase D family protein [Allocatelliglobosispora scoriae]MBB5868299.1 phosphatidylserine/phosphatidylglycerophosphate/cardiolipin synthase-like enzyme [Allocatelliglobosispora scoriae]